MKSSNDSKNGVKLQSKCHASLEAAEALRAIKKQDSKKRAEALFFYNSQICRNSRLSSAYSLVFTQLMINSFFWYTKTSAYGVSLISLKVTPSISSRIV